MRAQSASVRMVKRSQRNHKFSATIRHAAFSCPLQKDADTVAVCCHFVSEIGGHLIMERAYGRRVRPVRRYLSLCIMHGDANCYVRNRSTQDIGPYISTGPTANFRNCTASKIWFSPKAHTGSRLTHEFQIPYVHDCTIKVCREKA